MWMALWTKRWTSVAARGITAGVLWMWCGWRKNLQIGGVKVLCRRSGGSRTALPLETGSARGRPWGRGEGRETGVRRGCLAPVVGSAVCGGRAIGVLGGGTGRGPSISYMEGPRFLWFILPESPVVRTQRHAKSRVVTRNPRSLDRGHVPVSEPLLRRRWPRPPAPPGLRCHTRRRWPPGSLSAGMAQAIYSRTVPVLSDRSKHFRLRFELRFKRSLKKEPSDVHEAS
jgi:hypothetical protein